MIAIDQPTPYDNHNHDQLRDTANQCRACGLCQDRHHVVFCSGPVPAPLMIIGEGPGQQEDEQGLPFVGRAGQLLTSILSSVGIDRERTYITNTVKCRPPENRTPTPAEMTACQPFLIRQIQLVQPQIIILLGTAAVRDFLGTTDPISKQRGLWVTTPVSYMTHELYIMPMFHPSYLLRNASKEKGSPKWLTWQDMKEVKIALDFYATMTLL
jgi:uracil-DNA glycosylase family 4